MPDTPDFEGDSYTETNDIQTEQASVLFRIFRDHVLTPDTILDIGCGTGELTERLARRYQRATIVGVDASESQIEVARENSTQPNTEYVAADILDYTPESEFDAVFSNAALHWITNQHALYSHLRDICTDDATIAVHQGHRNCYIELRDAAFQAASDLGFDTEFADFDYPIAYYTPEIITELLGDHGFETEHTIVEESTGDDGLIEAFIEAGLLPFREQVPDGYEETFIDRFEECAPSPEEVTVKRLYFAAQRNS